MAGTMAMARDHLQLAQRIAVAAILIDTFPCTHPHCTHHVASVTQPPDFPCVANHRREILDLRRLVVT